MDSHIVSFITVEDGTDLIVSFAVIDPEDGFYLDCLNVIRTPKYERFLEPYERFPKVSFPLVDDDIERRNLVSVSYSKDEDLISIGCEGATYTLDLSKVDREEIGEMVRVFHKMCRDSGIELSGI